MLHNPDWDKTAKPDVMSVEGLAAWLETQQPETMYVYGDCRDCLICRYVEKFCGRTYKPVLIDLNTVGAVMERIALGTTERDRNYGDALKRCRRYLATGSIY
jgi:hypothetical protein